MDGSVIGHENPPFQSFVSITLCTLTQGCRLGEGDAGLAFLKGRVPHPNVQKALALMRLPELALTNLAAAKRQLPCTDNLYINRSN